MPTELQTISELQELPAIRAYLQTRLAGMHHPQLTTAIIDAVLLASVEAVTNIIKHAYADATDRALRVCLSLQDDLLCITLLHHGDRAMPEQIGEPDFSGMREDGFGLFIIHELMDTVTYGREAPDWQCITMTKSLL